MTEGQADVAQLVEQLIRNQQVNGSSPFVGSILSITCQSADGRLVSNWSPSDFGLQFLHGFMGRFWSCLDVEALRCAPILMLQNELGGLVVDTQSLEVGCKSTTIGLL
jgi:hypothetical protein